MFIRTHRVSSRICAGLSLSVGAEGVGLYRTEMPFMVRDTFPTEDEQRAIYRQLLKAFEPVYFMDCVCPAQL